MLVLARAGGYKRCDKVGKGIGYEVNYYAHTAVRLDGKPDRNPAKWQLLSTHWQVWLSSNVSPKRPFHGCAAENKTGEDCPRRLCLRNAFDQVYPHGG